MPQASGGPGPAWGPPLTALRLASIIQDSARSQKCPRAGAAAAAGRAAPPGLGLDRP